MGDPIMAKIKVAKKHRHEEDETSNGGKKKAKKKAKAEKNVERVKLVDRYPLDKAEIGLVDSGDWKKAIKFHAKRNECRMHQSAKVVIAYLSDTVREVREYRKELKANAD